METKKEFRYFSIFNHKKEEEYLSSMHKNGWKFVKATGLGTFHFEKCEPSDVVYQLDYTQNTKETIEEYKTMFSDCGWEYITEVSGYSYFRKPRSEMKGDEEIFNDEASRIAMMERVLKGRFTPLFVIFTACLLPQFIINLTAGRYGLSTFFGGIMAVYIVLFVAFIIYYFKQKNK